MFVDEFGNRIEVKKTSVISFDDRVTIDWFSQRPVIKVRKGSEFVGNVFTDDWSFKPGFLSVVTFEMYSNINQFIEIEKEKLCVKK